MQHHRMDSLISKLHCNINTFGKCDALTHIEANDCPASGPAAGAVCRAKAPEGLPDSKYAAVQQQNATDCCELILVCYMN